MGRSWSIKYAESAWNEPRFIVKTVFNKYVLNRFGDVLETDVRRSRLIVLCIPIVTNVATVLLDAGVKPAQRFLRRAQL